VIQIPPIEDPVLEQGVEKVKKSIWIPLLLGGVLGLLDMASMVVDFLIPLGPYGATGPQEVFILMSAALGGPIGLSVACILHEAGNYFFGLKAVFSPEQIASVRMFYSIADFSAHILAALAVAYCYKFLYQRAQKVYVFFAGWILIVYFYYLLLVLLQFILIGLVIDLPSLSTLYRNFMPEFLVVTIISTLIWIALPKRYHRHLWVEQQPLSPPTGDGAMSKDVQI